ncbi:flagellar assembly protein A [Sulfuricurvum sp.]|uniref:flagellar assembly protein A n=1 Tax=Sulfuricurvum sp. TaxID=2025608 RepID=UPI002614850F|nr:flagellar assembly protein A [Sulfuricurvum sp.]MDD2266973.1 hypothetical protein [Sulfuricurvum sp.]
MNTPVILISTNVMNDLLSVAKDQRIPADGLDFDLLSYETYYKGTVDEEWQHLIGNNLLESTTEVEIRSSVFLLRQEYQIRIRKLTPHPYLDLRFTIATDKHKTKAVAIIDPRSTIPLKKGVQEWIKDAIMRKQLRHRLMIGIFDVNIDQEINRLLLKIQKEGPLKEPYRLPISECFPPVQPISDKVLLHYKELSKTNTLIHGVQPGDLILEYIFPKHGRDGRSCDGEHIEVDEPSVKYAKYIVIDEKTITSQEDSASIRFYANASGYIQRHKGIFSISHELQIESASFKKTGSIEAGIDKEISLKIKKKVSNEDSIGSGVNIDVQKLDVSGTVGSNSNIQACEVNIGAQTHKKSQINVTEVATIHLHRGNLKAKEANIDILEAGKIEAEIVRIKTMVGGEIVAHKVYIDTLHSNAKITALELIEIQRIEGGGNNLIINPDGIESYHEKIASMEMNIRDKTSRLQEHSKEFITKQLSFKEKNSRIKQFQLRVLEAQKNGKEPTRGDVVRLMQYKAEANALKEFSEKLKEDELSLHALRDELEKIYAADIHAEIIHHNLYNGHNRVVFIDPKTHREYAISPEGKVTHIRLRQVGDEKKLLLES